MGSIVKKKIIPHNKPTVGKEEAGAAVKVLRSNWLAQGIEVERFESELCSFLGLPEGHALAVSSGTAALFLSLKALESKNVAFPAYACSALRNAVAMAGAKEIVLDTESNSPNIDLKRLRESGVDTAIVPHMYGLPIDLSGFNKINIIEDCAQALGAVVNGKMTGLQGKLGVFSFYATKLITSGGQGGMVVSKDRDLIDKIRDYREFDQRRDDKKRFNFQMTDLQAAIGRVQLKKLPGFLKRRSEIFKKYKESGLSLLDIKAKNIKLVRYRAILMNKDPQKILAALKTVGVKAIIPIKSWELLAKLPNALKLTNETVSLPCYPSLTDKEVQLIIEAVKNI